MVRLAQLVEQWTGNPEAGGSSLPSNLNFRMLTELVLISFIKPEVRKTLNMNNIIRTITFSKKYSHVTNLYMNLNLLKLNDIYKLELAKFMYQLHYETVPKSFHDRFIKLCTIHNYSTRQKQNLVYFKPQIKKAIGRELLAHRSSNLRKKIKPSIEKLGWFSFKTQYKNFFIKNYNSA